MLEEKMFAFAMLGSEWVLWLLVLLSAACVTVAIERTLYLRQNRTPLDKLQRALSGFLEGDSREDFSTNLQNISGIEANVLRSGLKAHERGGHTAAENAIAGKSYLNGHDWTKALSSLERQGQTLRFRTIWNSIGYHQSLCGLGYTNR